MTSLNLWRALELLDHRFVMLREGGASSIPRDGFSPNNSRHGLLDRPPARAMTTGWTSPQSSSPWPAADRRHAPRRRSIQYSRVADIGRITLATDYWIAPYAGDDETGNFG